jgi:hypothetical protein
MLRTSYSTRISRTPAAVLAAVTAFILLVIPAMHRYPGGTDWDPATRGHDFWLNYLCDLTRQVALTGQPNPVGAAFAQAALAVLALGLLPLWWLLPRLFPSRARLGTAVRVLGSVGAAGTLAVVLMPSDRFGGLHGMMIVLAGPPALTAALLAVLGLAREERTPRVAAAIGGAMLLVASVDFALYARQLVAGGTAPMVVAVLERISAMLVLAWMAAVSLRAARVKIR